MMKKTKVQFQDLGLISYEKAWEYQTELHNQLKATKKYNRLKKETEPVQQQNHYLLFCEHPHVYTLGKSGSKEHLLLNENELEEKNIEFFPINRGGDITYHGPGQIVGYPILDMDFFFNDVHKYVRDIEEVIIRTLSDYQIAATRIDGLSGVWLEGDNIRPKRKICAIGIHMSRWVTLHGFAFNVNTDLSLFNNIIPCGINDADKSVTSLAMELGEQVDYETVKKRVKFHFADLFGAELLNNI